MEYKFSGISANDKCDQFSSCYGWSLDGKYKVSTDLYGETVIVVDTTVTAPYDLSLEANTFYAGWGVAYGAWKDKTEAFIALNNMDVSDFDYSWKTKSF
jgi:hypothetical protein